MATTADPLEELRKSIQALDALERQAASLRRRTRRTRALDTILIVSLVAGCVGVWLASLLRLDPDRLRQMSDVGLISVLPVPALGAAVFLTLSFCLTLRRFPRSPLLPLLHVLALIVMLFGTPAVIEQEPRFAVAWQHAGIAEAVMRTGHVFPYLDIYGNWPGFFIAAGFLAKAIGVSSPLVFVAWASVFFNLLYLAPLLFLFRSLAREPRIVWLAVWFFYVGNWIGQDYFSPQALAYLLYLASLALLVRVVTDPHPGETRPASGERRERVALIALAALLALASIPTHQLTPVQIAVSFAFLALTSRRLPKSLPLLIGASVLAWAAFVATPYLAGHLSGIIQGVGNVGSSVNQGVSQRVAGAPGHVLVTEIRLAVAAAFGLLAVSGGLHLLRARRLGGAELRSGGLAVLPICLLPAVQSYGGEVGLRAFLYALPFLSVFAARTFELSGKVRSVGRSTSAAGVVLVLLLAAFPFARYGNERTDFFTRDEKRAADFVYQHVRTGSLIVAGSWSLPWRYRGYELYRYEILDSRNDWRAAATTRNWRPLLRSLSAEMSRQASPAYIIVSRSQMAAEDLSGYAPGALQALTRALRGWPSFRVAYSNRDAVVFTTRRPA